MNRDCVFQIATSKLPLFYTDLSSKCPLVDYSGTVVSTNQLDSDS